MYNFVEILLGNYGGKGGTTKRCPSRRIISENLTGVIGDTQSRGKINPIESRGIRVSRSSSEGAEKLRRKWNMMQKVAQRVEWKNWENDWKINE
jgi:hypothetical protein